MSSSFINSVGTYLTKYFSKVFKLVFTENCPDLVLSIYHTVLEDSRLLLRY